MQLLQDIEDFQQDEHERVSVIECLYVYLYMQQGQLRDCMSAVGVCLARPSYVTVSHVILLPLFCPDDASREGV